MNELESLYWQKFFADCAKAAFIVIALPGLAVSLSNPSMILSGAAMAAIGSLLAAALAGIGASFISDNSNNTLHPNN
jgi:hypothetical protein